MFAQSLFVVAHSFLSPSIQQSPNTSPTPSPPPPPNPPYLHGRYRRIMHERRQVLLGQRYPLQPEQLVVGLRYLCAIENPVRNSRASGADAVDGRQGSQQIVTFVLQCCRGVCCGCVDLRATAWLVGWFG